MLGASQLQERPARIILFLRIGSLTVIVPVCVGGDKLELDPRGVPGAGGPPIFHFDGDNGDIVSWLRGD